ncbi:MAG TPA: dTDP-4-dehydrorhamnose 3,5-epimerase [Methylophilaceae bacterium]|nr:dTDP-4-dehydrorhamnose 3,5-epimerase [Methylophilaceae bacterium]
MSINFSIENSKYIAGVRIIAPSVHNESRGSIWTSYDSGQIDTLIPNGLTFRHDKFSSSKYNVLRGIHGDHKSWKLVSCVYGHVLQVVVDLRKNSSTYLEHECFDLDYNDHRMVLIPPGLGNAFYVKSEIATYHYKLAYDGDYADADEQFTLAWNDPRINIDWPTNDPILSGRDKRL